MNKFTTRNDAINFLAGLLWLTTDGAEWVYENSNCPKWDDAEFDRYDFLADPAVAKIPSEFLS
jgi:hypothetical protein